MSNDLPLSKENILDAAEQVLRRFGPDKTSVVDVARVLKVSHGTLYRHFSSKAALRESVTERWLHQNILAPLKDVTEQFDGNAKEQLRLWLDTLIRSKRSYAVDDSEMFAMYASVALEAVDMITQHVDQLIGQLARILEKVYKTGSLKRWNQRLRRELFLMQHHDFIILLTRKSGNRVRLIRSLPPFGI